MKAPRVDLPSTDETGRNKAIFGRFDEAINSRDPELICNAIDELAAPDLVIRTPLPVKATGAQALKEVWTTLLRAFPDLQVRVEDLIAEGDKVVFKWFVDDSAHASSVRSRG
jgi:ketosteroid isomerase-like protein